MLVVMALGGNAILQRGQPLDVAIQRQNIQQAVYAIAKVAKQHRVVLTHGNGPQIGLLALQTVDSKEVFPYPLDVLGAETQGMLGYILEQELRNHLPNREFANLVTQVEVAKDDPAFARPEKYIGPVYTEAQARQLAERYDWQIAQDGNYFRRVVSSPLPQRFLQSAVIQQLVETEVIVICAGGGGVPVIRDANNHYQGVEAVIDKDLAAALLALELRADRLLILTDVPAVMRNWGREEAKAISEVRVPELKQMTFAAGSMAPKIKAACQFVESTGGIAHIGALADAAMILQGKAGTMIIN